MRQLASVGEESEMMSQRSPAKHSEKSSNQLTFNEYEALQMGFEQEATHMKNYEFQTIEEEKGPKLKQTSAEKVLNNYQKRLKITEDKNQSIKKTEVYSPPKQRAKLSSIADDVSAYAKESQMLEVPMHQSIQTQSSHMTKMRAAYNMSDGMQQMQDIMDTEQHIDPRLSKYSKYTSTPLHVIEELYKLQDENVEIKKENTTLRTENRQLKI